MNTTFDILVIVLSCLLGIFLIIAIVVAAMMYKLVKALKTVVAKGEHLVDSAEEIGDALRKNAGAVGMVRMLLKFLSKVK